ncbi:MAG: hypothetical protein JO033_29300, partial [Acidobacteriaceae bacterium]|nr:hypothetical protein [Acidobacteriaceae bacterium]
MRAVRNAAVHRSSGAAHPQRTSSAGPGDSEVLGIAINPGGPYTGIAGFQTAYQPLSIPQTTNVPQIQLGYPAGASGTSSLLAPLFLPPNGSCLSPTPLYDNSGAVTNSFFLVLDFCTGGVDAVLPIDNSPNTQQYIGNVNGNPGFFTATLTLDAAPTSTSTWYTLLYNFATGQFDLLASSVGVSSTSTGLSIFDSAFVQGQCPITPNLAANGMALYNANTGGFEPLAPTMTGTTSVVISVASNDNCFVDDVSGPASFSFSILNANTDWQVTANPPPANIMEYDVPEPTSQGITSGPDGA